MRQSGSKPETAEFPERLEITAAWLEIVVQARGAADIVADRRF
jgi:hypothetical protein